MWHHCIVCSADLGVSEELEAFTIGNRLAFDAAKGRLWVVCPRCERWNLVPVEQRWEAVEALEGELERLAAAWREAEELAAISDNLILPKGWKAFKAYAKAAGATAPDRADPPAP